MGRRRGGSGMSRREPNAVRRTSAPGDQIDFQPFLARRKLASLHKLLGNARTREAADFVMVTLESLEKLYLENILAGGGSS